MAGSEPKTGLRSVAGKRPLKSRGYLSHSGSQLPATADQDQDAGQSKKHHRSRGNRQAVVSADAKPQDLSRKPPIKPYRLEDQ